MKRFSYILLGFFLLLSVDSVAQKLIVESFGKDVSDQVARYGSPRKDQNGKSCAIVKIETTLLLSDFTFDAGSMGVVHTEQKNGEIWVYLSPGTQRITITNKHFEPLRNYPFGEPLQEATVYILSLKSGTVKTVIEEEMAYQYLEVQCDYSSVTIKIDSGVAEPFDNGSFRKLLAYGKHTYVIESPLYYPLAGKVEITSVKAPALKPVLEPRFSVITFISDGDIYVNDVRKGTGKCVEQLLPGMYKVQVQKASHRATQTAIEIKEANNRTITLPSPTPVYGSLDINSNVNADIYIDNQTLQQVSPYFLSRSLIGKHTVALKAKGYKDYTADIEVEEGKIAKVSATLQKEDRTEAVGGISIEMISVDGGTFMMGCSSDQGSDCDGDEKPLHSVTLSSFQIGKYEVTQAQWQAVMGSNPSYFKGVNLPVESVSWDDVQEFIRKLNAQTGKGYRLPTEAEWEFAARGGNKSKGYIYSGSHTPGSVAWYYGNAGDTTHVVGTKLPNELGIYDMSGNVWEWCSDWYNWYDTYPSLSQQNPTGPREGSYRVIRGGSWNGSAADCRVADRGSNTPSIRYSILGFRLVLP
jgi:formylglycine-generating enzyme required for sulfatase activity